MFIGHFAAALAAKRAAPRASLGVLFAACQLPDLLWPIFLLLGLEEVRITPGVTAFNPLEFTHYPITHSLLATLAWAAVAGWGYWRWRRDRAGAAAVAALVVSHWVLDWVTHVPDLPIWPGGPKVGLGLWDSIGATLAVEVPMFAIGVALYLSVARPRAAIPWLALGSLLAALLGIYFGGIGAPPPPSPTAIGWVALAAWLFPLWAWWADRDAAAT